MKHKNRYVYKVVELYIKNNPIPKIEIHGAEDESCGQIYFWILFGVSIGVLVLLYSN